MVVLLSGAQVAGRVLTDADGSFRIGAPQPGRYELRVDRIGYASTFSGAFEVAAGQMVERAMRTSVEPIGLEGIGVVGSGRCDARTAPGVATVWDEARKALEAATWTVERELYSIAWTRYVRELHADGERILDERTEHRRSYTPQPFTALDPDTLAAVGFVRAEAGGDVYLAPDAGVLLSDAFLDGHCFGLDAQREEGRTLVGLRFEPLRDRRMPDVEGVLWLDEESGRLQRLDYGYVNLGRAVPVQGQDAHGSIRFRALPNGTWIVEAWSIRMPRLIEVQDDLGRPRRLDVSGYVEEGGVVTSIRTAAGAVVSASSASIVGTVTDSLGIPFPDAHVSIIGTDLETITDATGSFRLDDIRAGTWSVSASHPELVAYGHPGSRVQVSVGPSGTGRADLQLTSVAAATADRCRGSPSVPGETAILIGRVVRPDDRPAPRADVRAVWTIARGAYRRTLEGFGTTADGAGAFTLCGVPVDRVVLARATGEDGATGTAEVRVPTSADVAPIVIGLENGPAPAGGVTTAVAEDRDDEAAWLGAVGFDLRAGHALLHLDRSEIAATGHDRLEEILDDVPRLEVRRLVAGDSELRLHPSSRVARGADDESCPLDVYVNGSLVQYRGDRGLGLQTTLQPRFITAIEVYDAAHAPVGSADACGVVLLWISLLRQADDPGFSGAIRGRVLGPYDAAGADALTLRLRPGDLLAMVDAQGRFDFGPVAPAPYTIEATVPDWGILSTPVDVRARYALDIVVDPVIESIDVAPRSDAAATLGAPSPAEAREALCSAQEPGSAMVMGRVLDGRTGEPVAGVRVDVRWAFSPGLMDWTDVRRDFSTLVGVTTDERGVYLVCGVPAPSSVRVAVRGAAPEDWLSVDVVKRDVVVRDLTVR